MRAPARVLMSGPLARFADGFAGELAQLGYAPRSAEDCLRQVAHLSEWLDRNGLGVGEFSEEVAQLWVRTRAEEGDRRRLYLQVLRIFRCYLDGLGVLPAVSPPIIASPTEHLLADYRRYLIDERGLVERSATVYVVVARRFLAERPEPIAESLETLTGGDINRFVQRATRRGGESARKTVVGLRSLLRFLFFNGWTASPLAQAVPCVAGRRDGLPRALDETQVAALLASCDHDCAVGLRDFAVLTVLARLGVRAGEVAKLKLGDVDWRLGEVLIRGKASRLEKLPLPSDVGEAIVDYLRRGRPQAACRELFLRSCAPVVGLSSPGIGNIVRSASIRAGIPAVGAHRLRHSCATTLLRRGAPLAEIGQLLRHNSPAATAIYAKVDMAALSVVALPWPGTQS